MFDYIDLERVECPTCGAEFNEEEIEGQGKCPSCGEPI